MKNECAPRVVKQYYIRNVNTAKFILQIPHFVVLFPFTLCFAVSEFRISWKGRRREMKWVFWGFRIKCVSDCTDDWIVSSLIGSPPLLCARNFVPEQSVMRNLPNQAYRVIKPKIKQVFVSLYLLCCSKIEKILKCHQISNFWCIDVAPCTISFF